MSFPFFFSSRNSGGIYQSFNTETKKDIGLNQACANNKKTFDCFSVKDRFKKSRQIVGKTLKFGLNMSIDITLAAESVQDPYAEQFKVIY